MTKKLFFTLSIIAFLGSCGTRRSVVQDPATFDEGVVINDVRWATRNVDMPGTFAETPESSGMFFQWNRRKGWNTIDEEVEGWDSAYPTGVEWYFENDPCPTGWRVPTREEIQSLYNAESIWTTQNNVDGRLFGTYPNQIFLPAVGWRNRYGVLGSVAVGINGNGNYWSRTQIARFLAWDLWFNYVGNYVGSTVHSVGFSIRCVAK